MKPPRSEHLRDLVVRRVTPADAPLLAEGFARLGAESRRLRFLGTKVVLTADELRYLTEVDGHRHEALGALHAASGEGVGIARFVRDADDPLRAEVAVTVADAWQRRGVGSLLLERLADRAREEGVERFTALVAGDNRGMQALLNGIGTPVRAATVGDGTIEYEVELPRAGLGAQLAEALRAAGQGRLHPPATLLEALRRLVPFSRS